MFHTFTRIFSWRWIFRILAFAGLIVLPVLAIDAGNSGDEELHLNQSVKVLNFYGSFGRDTAAIHTPGTHLKYYGQSFDNLTTLLASLFRIEEVYLFRHLMNSLAGWTAILMTALLVVYLAGYRAGTFVFLLFYLSPVFTGHAFNNLKDIPFALGYILSLICIFRVVEGLPKPRIKHMILLIGSIGFTISIRIGGVVTIAYLLVFTGLYLFGFYLKDRRRVTFPVISRSVLVVLLISVAGYLAGLLFWPYALENPLRNPWISFKVMASFPTILRQIFEGRVYWSDQLPWYYIPKYMLITIPVVVWVGFISFLALLPGALRSRRWMFVLFLLISCIFPLFFVIWNESNLYGAWRHMLFIFPPLVAMAAIGFDRLLVRFPARWIKITLGILLVVMVWHPVRFMVRNHPYQYLYFNELTGGIAGAYSRYETDYYYHSMREASLWLATYIGERGGEGDPGVIVAANFPVHWFFRKNANVEEVKYIRYYERGNERWDYAIIGNSYIHPWQLKEGTWPPANTIHTVRVEDVPVCAVIERRSCNDVIGYESLKRGDTLQAVAEFKKSLVTDPFNESVLGNLAGVYVRTGALDSAIHVLEQLLAIYPEYEAGLNLKAEIFRKEGNTGDAIKLLLNILETNPRYGPSYVKLSELYLTGGEEEMAVRYLRRCLQMVPGYRPALVKMGEFYERRGENELAKKYFGKAGLN